MGDRVAPQVELIAPDVVLFVESSQPSVERAHDGFDQVTRLVPTGCFFLLVDLKHASRPDAATRHAIRDRMRSYGERLQYVVLATGKNAAMNVAALFILRMIGLDNFEIVGSRAQALATIDALRQPA